MIKCVNCGQQIEEDNEFCYFCGMDPHEKNSNEEPSTEILREAGRVNNECFDYSLHGENPMYELDGNSGKSMIVYSHKCVIRTAVSFSSVMGGNATDGEKTIYFKDVIGVNFKEAGLLNGYLQLETASSKSNNNSKNFADENSFTYENKNYNEVYDAYRYIIHRLDEIKSI